MDVDLLAGVEVVNAIGRLTVDDPVGQIVERGIKAIERREVGVLELADPGDRRVAASGLVGVAALKRPGFDTEMLHQPGAAEGSLVQARVNPMVDGVGVTSGNSSDAAVTAFTWE